MRLPSSSVMLYLLTFVAVVIAAAYHLYTKLTMDNNEKTTPEAEGEELTGQDWTNAKTVYEFTAKDIDGNDVSLSKYKGHPLLIVNVASKCGLTGTNYKELNEVYDRLESRGLRILAFPCNQFGHQEPGCSVDIKEFAKKKGARYDFFDKVDVNGNSAHPLWKWLKKQQGGLVIDAIKWNFSKFLVDKNGVPIKRYAPTTTPNKIALDIEPLL